MRRRARDNTGDPGHDSFLDIVANLVGILIILIMIVGAQAKDAMLQAEVREPKVDLQEVEVEKSATVAVRHEVQTLMDKSRTQEIEIAYRQSERDRILAMMAAARHALSQQREDLSREQQEAHDLQVQIAAAEQLQEELKLSREALETASAPVQVLKHRPTPLAKTVFGQEVHFRLKGGRIVFVPIDELVEQFKEEARQKVWKLRNAPAITETVGPIRDFRLKYTLTSETRALGPRSGSGFQNRVELDHFVLVPVRDDLGEPVVDALQTESQFRSLLGAFDPHSVTVTVWVYPDSFPEYRLLKEELYQLGFLTASRPMPEGQPISGSPQGTRSAVQ